MSETPDLNALKQYLEGWQEQLCAAISSLDGAAVWQEDQWQHRTGGGGRSRALAEGEVFEKGGINYSRIRGERLAPASTSKRPELAGQAFQATGASLVLHPRNPYVPTAHCNLRFFSCGDKEPVWWFGGGYDLTPCYPFHEDALAWHRAARECVFGFWRDSVPAV